MESKRWRVLSDLTPEDEDCYYDELSEAVKTYGKTLEEGIENLVKEYFEWRDSSSV